MCCYTTLWNIFKNPVFNRLVKQIILSRWKRSCWKIFVQWVCHYLVNWQKYIRCRHINKSKWRSNVCTWSNQEERHRGKVPSHTNNVQSLLMTPVVDLDSATRALDILSFPESWHRNLLQLKVVFCHMSYPGRVLSFSAGHITNPHDYETANVLVKNLIRRWSIYYSFNVTT